MTDPVFPDLKGRSVFITGGGAGIGAALTEAFLRQGAKVAFCQRSDATPFCDAMEQATGNRPLFLPCDIAVTDQLQLTLATAAKAHGPITTLVNNAANDQRHDTLKTDQASGTGRSTSTCGPISSPASRSFRACRRRAGGRSSTSPRSAS
jgi:NAD(P)-dependent dehydrogenase (short-subunit alcohol dehydrogenase family)